MTRKILIGSAILAGMLGIALVLFLPGQQRPVPPEDNPAAVVSSQAETVAAPSPAPEEERAGAFQRSYALILTDNQITYQLLPPEQRLESQREELASMFERLYEREKRRGVVVERGEPLVTVEVPILNPAYRENGSP